MKAGVIRCPMCEAPLKDVAEDYEITPEDRPYGYARSIIYATCAKGHKIFVEWTPHRLIVQVVP